MSSTFVPLGDPSRHNTSGVVPGLTGRFRSLDWRVQVGAVWLLGRLFTAALTLAASWSQPAVHGMPAHPDYFTYAGNWDGSYYRAIHDTGYPSELPRDADGNVKSNVWAFMPAYPSFARLITSQTGLGWNVVAPTVSAVAALGFLLVAYRIFRDRADHGAALTGVALLSFAPAAPILQFDYAESLAFLLVALMLWSLARGRCLLAILPALAAGLTRPLAAPIAVTCIAVTVLIFFGHRQAGTRVPGRLMLQLAALCAITITAVAIWPVTAGVVTGEPGAYILTEASWWGGYGQLGVSMFLLFFVGACGVVWGVTLAVLTVAGLVIGMLSRRARSIGDPMWSWTCAYIGYLVLLTPIDLTTPRLLLAAFPLALIGGALSRRWAYRWALLAASAAAQVAFMFFLWRGADGSFHP